MRFVLPTHFLQHFEKLERVPCRRDVAVMFECGNNLNLPGQVLEPEPHGSARTK